MYISQGMVRGYEEWTDVQARSGIEEMDPSRQRPGAAWRSREARQPHTAVVFHGHEGGVVEFFPFKSSWQCHPHNLHLLVSQITDVAQIKITVLMANTQYRVSRKITIPGLGGIIGTWTLATNSLGRHSASAQRGLLDLHKRAINEFITTGQYNMRST